MTLDIRERPSTITASDVADWAQVGALVAAAISAIIIVAQLRQAERQHKIDRAADLLGRYKERDFLAQSSKALGFLTVPGPAACVERIWTHDAASHSEEASLACVSGAPPPCRNDLKHFVNFFEEMAGAYNAGQLDQKLSDKLLANVAVGQYGMAWWYICWQRGNKVGGREKDETTLFLELQLMVHDCIRRTSRVGDQITSKPTLLLLPPEGAPFADWLEHSTLTRTINDVLSAKGGWGETHFVPLLGAMATGVAPGGFARSESSVARWGTRVVGVPPATAGSDATRAFLRAAEEVRVLVDGLSRKERATLVAELQTGKQPIGG
ncbi:MAG: hypothetical protein AB7O78_03390 [Thermoleophilia bacterium]